MGIFDKLFNSTGVRKHNPTWVDDCDEECDCDDDCEACLDDCDGNCENDYCADDREEDE